MAQSKATHSAVPVKAAHRSKELDRIAEAMASAARDARKKLATEGLKLPTQNWKGGPVRNPVV